MYSLFGATAINRNSVYTTPDHVGIKNGLLRELEIIRNTYQGFNKWSSNNNIITSILASLPIPMSMSYQKYFDSVRNVTDQLTVKHRLSSPIHLGDIRNDGQSFYNRSVSEIYISVNESLNIEIATKEWRRLEPVRVISHPFSDMSLALPNGDYPYSCNSGLAVILINIPVLAFMYRRWLEEVKSKTKGNDLPLHSFVANYVIPSILPSHVDVARFNRLYNKTFVKPLATYKPAHSFFLTDFTSRIDNDLNVLIKQYSNTPLTYIQMLVNLRAISRDSYFDVLRIPSMALTRQIQSHLFAARLSTLHLLLTLNPTTNATINKQLREELKVCIRQMEGDQVLLTGIPFEAQYQFDQIKMLLND